MIKICVLVLGKEYRVSNSEKLQIPVIAVTGTQGGVGKTTIANKLADLLTMNESKSNILVMDFDLETRASTLRRIGSSQIDCNTVRQYIDERIYSVDGVIDTTKSVQVRNEEIKNQKGKLYLIPAALPGETNFDVIRKTDTGELLDIVKGLVKTAADQYKVDCIVIDCEAKVDFPITAAAAHISKYCLVVGRNEIATYKKLQEYSSTIKAHYIDFNSEKMKIVLNQVLGAVLDDIKDSGFLFQVIPSISDISLITEGVKDVDAVRMTLFDNFILEILEKIFTDRMPQLVPDKKVILSADWCDLVDKAPQLANYSLVRIARISKKVLPFAIIITILLAGLTGWQYVLQPSWLEKVPVVYFLIVLISAGVISLTVWQIWKRLKDSYDLIDKIIDKKEEFVLVGLRSRNTREGLERLKNWASKIKNKE